MRISLEDVDEAFVGLLNNVRIDSRFDGLIHDDPCEAEFFFGYLRPESDLLRRRFAVRWRGKEFSCRYDAPSPGFWAFTKQFRRAAMETSAQEVASQLRAFQRAMANDLPETIRAEFQRHIPTNFFIAGPLRDVDLGDLARQTNFVMEYYDRQSPRILIRNRQPVNERPISPLRYMNGSFPIEMNLPETDEVLLTLLEVASLSAPRVAYLHYYQVLEYVGHHYIDNKTRAAIKRIVKEPAIVSCDDSKLSELFTILTDHNHNDEAKIEKTIEENCDPRHIWAEVWNEVDPKNWAR